jgi:hypothetical protein
MATTTNYGWTTPDDTALVKDGASAIRTLGSSVDTTTKNLNPETTLGDLAYRSSTANVKTRLGLGTAGQFLAVNSGATAPEWQTLNAGGMTLISTTSLTGASVTLSSIPQTYVSLYLVMSGLTNATGNGVNRLAFNAVTNLTSTIGVYSSSVSVRNDTRLELGDGSSTLRTDANNIFVVQIDNYTSSSRYKTGLTRGSILDSASNRTQFNYSYVFGSNTALTSIVIDNSGGNLSTGTALLYGVK